MDRSSHMSEIGPKPMEADAKLRRMLQYIGEKVNLNTIFGSHFQGVFVGFDNHMNVILKDGTEMRRKFNRREAMPLAQAGRQGELEGNEEVGEEAEVDPTESGYGTAGKKDEPRGPEMYEIRNVGLVVVRGSWVTSITANIKQEDTPPKMRGDRGDPPRSGRRDAPRSPARSVSSVRTPARSYRQ